MKTWKGSQVFPQHQSWVICWSCKVRKDIKVQGVDSRTLVGMHAQFPLNFILYLPSNRVEQHGWTAFSTACFRQGEQRRKSWILHHLTGPWRSASCISVYMVLCIQPYLHIILGLTHTVSQNLEAAYSYHHFPSFPEEFCVYKEWGEGGDWWKSALRICEIFC